MAGYNIVLNLSGNAVSRAEKLAAALGVASANATVLASALRSVGAVSSSIPLRTIRVGSAGLTGSARTSPVDGRFREYVQSMTRQSDAIRNMNRYYRDLERSESHRTRHRSTRILSYGTGFSMGGFSGRFSNIFQPDSQGNLFGMNADTLMRNVNAGAIAASIMSGIGRAVLKAVKVSSFAPVGIGGGGLLGMLGLLQSEGFAGGVRLISRRHQARAGLGAGFEQAQSSADFLAASYGLDRSTALSSINVLTGLGIGGSGSRKINIAQATGLTKIGGLISQQAGVPFERVMTNIQQLLVQATPNIRDIRELLNQAPVLGKYALKEMEDRGVKGVDIRTYLKDQGALLNVLKRYELDNASNAGMQARGEISLAMQDFWAKLASNSSVWQFVGSKGSETIGALGNGLNALLTSLTKNDNFQNYVNNLSLTFERLADNTDGLVDVILSATNKIASVLGLDFGDNAEARRRTQQGKTIEGALGRSDFRAALRSRIIASGVLTSTGAAREGEIDQILNQFAGKAPNDPNLRSSVELIGRTANIQEIPWFERAAQYAGIRTKHNPMGFIGGATRLIGSINRAGYEEFMRTADSLQATGAHLNVPRDVQEGFKSGVTPNFAAYASAIGLGPLEKSLDGFLEDLKKAGGLTGTGGTGVTGSGADLSGFNKDRRNLEIHFHDAIVKWDSTIVASDPQETQTEIKDSLEQLTSEAIQKALLGATGKMNSRFF